MLCYHAVSDGWDDPLAVRPAIVLDQVGQLIRRGFAPVGVEHVVDGRRGLFHVTFDDAYRNIDPIIRELARRGVPTTVFACTSFSEGGPIPVAELRERIRGNETDASTLTWDELRSLADAGVEVGSHTVSHAHLTQLTDGALRHELRASKKHLESELERPCRFLAYPYGEHDARVQAAVREAGYVAAFALNVPGRRFGPATIPRVDIYRGDGMMRFAAKTSRPSSSMRTVRNLFRRGAA